VLIERIKLDPTLQLREGGLDRERIEDMRVAIADGVAMPPVVVVGPDDLLADGFHRVYSYEKEGKTEIDATHVDGGYNEALAIAIRANSNGAKQLTRTERKEGIKRLLVAGWTQERIAKATRVSGSTVSNIGTSLAMRGTTTLADSPKSHRKPVTVLPEAVHAKLDDTTLVRIAAVPIEQQQELAEAAAKVDLSEPRVRDAIRTMKERGISPTEAVDLHRERTILPPLITGDIVTFMRRRVEVFLTEPFRFKERDFTFAEALDFVVEHGIGYVGTRDLADTLASASVVFDHAATTLRSGRGLKAVQ